MKISKVVGGLSVIVPASELQRALEAITRAALKSLVPVLEYALLEALPVGAGLQISATNLKTWVTYRLRGTTRMVPGSVLVHADLLRRIAATVPPEASVAIEDLDGKVRVRAGGAVFEVFALETEGFPARKDAAPEPAGAIQLDAGTLASLISRTAFAIVCAADTRYYFNGACFQHDDRGVAVITTDGHRLAYARAAVPLSAAVPSRSLVPRDAVLLLAKLLETTTSPVTFQKSGGRLFFSAPAWSLDIEPDEDEFPKFESVIGPHGSTGAAMRTRREEFLGVLAKINVLTNPYSRAIRIALAEGKATISALSVDRGEATAPLAVTYEGPDQVVGFNSKYLRGALGAMTCDWVALELHGEDGAAYLRPFGAEADIDEYTYAVMPMRL